MTETSTSQRIDRWLWHARFVKTRSLAQKLVKSGKVRVDREKITSTSFQIRPGNVLTLALPRKVQIVEICDLADRRGPYSQACLLYKDLTPEEKISAEPAQAEFAQNREKEPRPDKHQRRKAIRLKQIYPDE